VVPISANVMHAARANLNDLVEVREEAGRIVIEPIRQKTYDLRRLVNRITSRNQHERVDFGLPAGKEVW
jgi:antitoxin MazE